MKSEPRRTVTSQISNLNTFSRTKKKATDFSASIQSARSLTASKSAFIIVVPVSFKDLFTASKIDLDGCNNRHSRYPLEPVVVDYEIVEPELDMVTPEILEETTVLMAEDVAAPITVQVEVTDGISRLKSDYSHSTKLIISTVLACLLLVQGRESNKIKDKPLFLDTDLGPSSETIFRFDCIKSNVAYVNLIVKICRRQ